MKARRLEVGISGGLTLGRKRPEAVTLLCRLKTCRPLWNPLTRPSSENMFHGGSSCSSGICYPLSTLHSPLSTLHLDAEAASVLYRCIGAASARCLGQASILSEEGFLNLANTPSRLPIFQKADDLR
jgi:hypothetical protein